MNALLHGFESPGVSFCDYAHCHLIALDLRLDSTPNFDMLAWLRSWNCTRSILVGVANTVL